MKKLVDGLGKILAVMIIVIWFSYALAIIFSWLAGFPAVQKAGSKVKEFFKTVRSKIDKKESFEKMEEL